MSITPIHNLYLFFYMYIIGWVTIHKQDKDWPTTQVNPASNNLYFHLQNIIFTLKYSSSEDTYRKII